MSQAQLSPASFSLGENLVSSSSSSSVLCFFLFYPSTLIIKTQKKKNQEGSWWLPERRHAPHFKAPPVHNTKLQESNKQPGFFFSFCPLLIPESDQDKNSGQETSAPDKSAHIQQQKYSAYAWSVPFSFTTTHNNNHNSSKQESLVFPGFLSCTSMLLAAQINIDICFARGVFLTALRGLSSGHRRYFRPTEKSIYCFHTRCH